MAVITTYSNTIVLPLRRPQPHRLRTLTCKGDDEREHERRSRTLLSTDSQPTYHVWSNIKQDPTREASLIRCGGAMNDDPTAASSAGRSPTNDHNNGGVDADIGEGSSSQQQPQHTRRRPHNGRRRSSTHVRRAKEGISKKLEFMTHLMSSLDVLVFAELCALYYME